MNRKERKHTNFCSEKRRRQTENRAVHCAQICRKYTPKGKMGHPKWQNGTSQKVVWGMRKWGYGHRNKGAEVEFWGVEGKEMGGMRPRKTPKIG